MNYSIKQQGGKIDYNYKELYVDSAADINSINVKFCSAGSVVYVIGTGDVYILNNEKEWVKQ